MLGCGAGVALLWGCEGVGALLPLSEDGQQLSGCPEECREGAEMRDGVLWDRGTKLLQLLLRESS